LRSGDGDARDRQIVEGDLTVLLGGVRDGGDGEAQEGA
jgi:hypothetical protein